MAISTNPKSTLYRNLYENTDPGIQFFNGCSGWNDQYHCFVHLSIIQCYNYNQATPYPVENRTTSSMNVVITSPHLAFESSTGHSYIISGTTKNRFLVL